MVTGRGKANTEESKTRAKQNEVSANETLISKKFLKKQTQMVSQMASFLW